MRRLKRETLLATGLGHPRNRLFCAAWRITGGEVTGFTHGNSICANYHKYFVCLDVSIANNVVTTSPSQKIIYKHFIEKQTHTEYRN